MAGKIFINYRRSDDAGFVQALFSRLEQAFLPEQLFMDVENIDPGLDFARVLEEQVAKCDVVLVVVGKGWVDSRDETGARRLDSPEDFVRIEIESALSHDKRLIPVLVGEARMPRSDELPETIRPLARRNAVRLTHERFRADAQGLVKALQQILEKIAGHSNLMAATEAERVRLINEAIAMREAEEKARQEENRKKIEQEIARQAEPEARRRFEEKYGLATSVAGTVELFNHERGYGFIKPDDGGRSVFVHITALERSGLKTLNEGQRIIFEIEPDKKGKGPKAINLVVSSPNARRSP
jgi:cold shock CspA family protein